MHPFDPQQIATHQAHLRRLAAAIVGENLADDVVQDTWMVALAGTREEPRRWRAWLSRVTHNLAWKRRLGEDRRLVREQRSVLDGAVPSPDELLEHLEQSHMLERCLTKMDEPYRSTLLWRYYGELSIAEISHRSGLPESTTRTHLQRGLGKLRERMQTEQGPEWRAALLPLVKRKAVGSTTAGSGALVGLGVTMMSILTKPVLIAAALFCVWILGEHWQGQGPVEVETPGLALVMEPALPDLEDPMLLDRDGPGEIRAAAGLQAAATLAPLPGPAPEPGTRLRITDARSGMGIPHARVKIRFRPQDSHRTKDYTLEADAEGQIELPFTLTKKERRSSGPLFSAEIIFTEATKEYSRYVSVNPLEGSQGFELRMEGAWVFSVQMPGELESRSLDATTATVAFDFDNGQRLVWSTRYRPFRRVDHELFFLLPPPDERGQRFAQREGFSLSFSDAAGDLNLRASLPFSANLGDGPYPVESVDLITQKIRILESTSGEPVGGVFVSLREPERPGNAPVVWSQGLTDDDGRISLSGVPSGPLLAIYSKSGYEIKLLEIETSVDDQELVLTLEEITGKSDLELTVSASGGRVPKRLNLTARLQPLGNVQAFKWVDVNARSGSGWSCKATLEALPPGQYHILVSSEVPGLETTTPFLVEVPSRVVHIELDVPPPSRYLHVHLPSGIRNADFWNDLNGSFLKRSTSFHDGTQVALVSEKGEPVQWMIYHPGYVPIVGGRDAWKDAKGIYNRDPIFELRPVFEEGWGRLLHIHGPGGDSIKGVLIRDPASGRILGESAADGTALIRSDGPLERVSISLGEARATEITFSHEPFQSCYLGK